MWVGYRSSNKPLENIEGFGAVYGGTIPAAIWKDFMTTATRRLPPHDWPEPKHADGLQAVQGDDVVRLQPGAARAAPAPPPAKAEAEAEAPPSPPTQVVIAPQNG